MNKTQIPMNTYDYMCDIFCYCRWLDEGDGENGIEQTLMLSEILVSDEEEAEEDLPGQL
jgi:hypothetical protein